MLKFSRFYFLNKKIKIYVVGGKILQRFSKLGVSDPGGIGDKFRCRITYYRDLTTGFIKISTIWRGNFDLILFSIFILTHYF
jgi:hypothetical protein